MIYQFPIPKEVPYEVKQKVMHKIFSKKWSLVKRASLVKVFSVSLSFVGIIVLFSWFYANPFSDSPYEEKVLPNDNKIVLEEELALKENSNLEQNLDSESLSQNLVVESQNIDDIELTVLEIENLISELESII